MLSLPLYPGGVLARAIGALILCPAVLMAGAWAQPAPPSQYDVQSAYLYNFAKFVRWPASVAHNRINFCIAGQKVYSDTLTKIVAGEMIDGHTLDVRRVKRPEEAADCDVLFIDRLEGDEAGKLLAYATAKPILTVGDSPDFLRQGGMIQFLLLDDRVRFSVNLQPVQASGLSLSSELLKVAQNVTGRAAGGPRS